MTAVLTWDQEHTIYEINPEPWTVGTVSVGRKGGKPFPMVSKDAQLRTFQNAVTEWFALRPQTDWIYPREGPVKLEFEFSRQRIAYESASGRMVRKHAADVTNLQKALEDALQGILYKNDNQVVDVRSVMVEQTFETDPCIVIRVKFLTDQGGIE